MPPPQEHAQPVSPSTLRITFALLVPCFLRARASEEPGTVRAPERLGEPAYIPDYAHRTHVLSFTQPARIMWWKSMSVACKSSTEGRDADMKS